MADLNRIELDIYVSEILYNIGLTCIKLSVLLFYVRVFTTSRLWFRLSVWTLGFLCIGWCVAITFLGCFQCDPPQASFNLSIKGNCLSQHDIYVGTAVPNVLIDFFLLILPLPGIKPLHAVAKNKIALAFIFILGYWYGLSRLLDFIGKTDLFQRHGRLDRESHHYSQPLRSRT